MLFKNGLNYTIIFDGYMLYDMRVFYPNGSYVRFNEHSLMKNNFMVLPTHRFSFSSLDTVFNIATEFYGTDLGKAMERYRDEPWYADFMVALASFSRLDGVNDKPFEEYILLNNGEVSIAFIDIKKTNKGFVTERRSYSLGHFSTMRAVLRREENLTGETAALRALVDSAICRDKLLLDMQRHGLFLGCEWVKCSSMTERFQSGLNKKAYDYWGNRIGLLIKQKFKKTIESIPEPLREEIKKEVFNADYMDKISNSFGIGAIS